MKIAIFAAAVLLSPAWSAAHSGIPTRLPSLPSNGLPLNFPIHLQAATPPPDLKPARQAAPAFAAVLTPAVPSLAAASLPAPKPLELPSPEWPWPSRKTICPGPRNAPAGLIFTVAAESAESSRNLFDGTRTSESLALPGN